MTRETLAAARHAAGDDKTLTNTCSGTSVQDNGGFSRREGRQAGWPGASRVIAGGRRDNSSESAAEHPKGEDRPLGDL